MDDSQAVSARTETAPEDPEILALLDFEPVPRKRAVEGAWTPELQREFIMRLAVTGSPGRACREMGKDDTGVGKLYRSPEGASFRAAWDSAVELVQRRKARGAAGEDPVAPGTRPPSFDNRRKWRVPYANPTAEDEEAEMMRLADEAKGRIVDRLVRIRRLYLQEISGCAGKRAAFEILTELPIDWEKAERGEAQPDEPYNIANQRQPDMILTAESGWTFGELGYSSITPEVASLAWSSFCNRNAIDELTRSLGDKLISNHGVESGGKSILTGPMFSHFVANLVLKEVDDRARELPAAYFRYVDDITFVGTQKAVSESLDLVTKWLSAIGFSLHTNNTAKDITVPVTEWLTTVSDFRDEEATDAWRNLIGDIKKFLLLHPKEAAKLEDGLRAEGFRFPLPDYAQAVSERTTFERVRELGLWRWLFRRSVPLDSIIADARGLAARYERETTALLERVGADSPFQRKRKISKMRYRLGRLVYLASNDALARLAAATARIDELRFHTAILNAIVTGDCSEVVSLGANVAQAAAQVFRAVGETARFSKPVSTDAELQGLAVFLLNGVSVQGEIRTERNPLVQFAYRGVDRDLMVQPRGFVQELACLHGLGEARHASVMKTAFDLAQDIVLDALELEYGYYM